jgi:hypothetical protein
MEDFHEQLNSQEKLMEKALRQHLAEKQVPEFSDYLFHKIITGVNRQQRAKFLRDLKIRLWTVAGFLAMTLFIFAVALEASLKAFAQTPTYNFISLAFTDFGAVMSNWQDYGFSILEALPLGAMAFLLAAVLASAVLGEYLLYQWQNFRRTLTKLV